MLLQFSQINYSGEACLFDNIRTLEYIIQNYYARMSDQKRDWNLNFSFFFVLLVGLKLTWRYNHILSLYFFLFFIAWMKQEKETKSKVE